MRRPFYIRRNTTLRSWNLLWLPSPWPSNVADALKDEFKRTRSVSPREPSTLRKQTTKKAATRSAPVGDGPQELIARIQNLDPTTSVSEIGPLLIRALQLLFNNNASVPATVPSPPTVAVARTTKTTPTRTSWAEMLQRHKPEERKKVNEELSKLRHQPPVPHQNKSQEVFMFRQVTIRNLAERPIKEIKNTLFTLRIRLGKNRKERYVGKATYEFLVDADYMKAFMNRMEQYGFPPAVDYEPLKPREENPTQEIVERIKTAGITRIARIIMTTKMDVVKRFYEAYSTERAIAVDVCHNMEEIRAESVRAARL